MKIDQDKLDKIFEEYRSEFDSKTPDKAHLGRFAVKMERIKKKIISIVPHLRNVAETFILVSLISYFTWDTFIRNRDEMSFGQVSKEYRQLEKKHKTDIKEKTKRVNVLLKNDPEFKKELETNMMSLDSIGMELRQLLKKLPDNQDIIDAQIGVDSIKIKFLDSMIKELETTKK